MALLTFVNSKDGILEDYQGKTRNQELALQLKIDDELNTALKDMATDKESLAQAEEELEGLAEKALGANGLTNEDVDIVFYNSDTMTEEQKESIVLGEDASKEDMNAFYDDDSGKIYINTSNLDGTNQELVTTLANELSHYVDDKKGREFDQERQDVSSAYDENAKKQIIAYNGQESGAEFDPAVYSNKESDFDFTQANYDAGLVKDVEPDITVQLHEVAFDKYHASIKFKPVNQELYEGDYRFYIDGSDGKLYMTIGAGPKGLNKLTGDINRDKDKLTDNKVFESLPIVPVEEEDEVFNQLIELNENYNQNPLEYDMFPNPNKTKIPKVSNVGGKLNRPGDSYNSNSYVSGILKSADVFVPPIDKDFDVPGYNKPVSKESFIGEN